MDDRKPWEPLDSETARQYQAFCVYLHPGPSRSLIGAYRKYSGKGDAKDVGGTLKKWSVQNKWVERATAYDAYVESLKAAQFTEAELADVADEIEFRREMRRRQRKTILKRLEKGEQILAYPTTRQTLLDDGKTVVIEPTRRWSLRDGAALIESAEKAMTDRETKEPVQRPVDEIKWGYETATADGVAPSGDGQASEDSGKSPRRIKDSPGQSEPEKP